MPSSCSGVTLISTNRSLLPFAGNKHGTSRGRHASRAVQRFLHGIAELAAVVLIHQGCNLRKGLSQNLVHLLAEKHFRGVIDVIDPPFRIHGDHALAHGIERRHCARFLGDFRRNRAGHHFQRGEQQRRLAGTVDYGAGELHARNLTLWIHQLDFVALRGRFSRQPPTQIVLHQLDIFRRYKVRQRPADDVRGLHSEQREKARIGKQNHFAMHEHGIVDGLDETLKQLFAILQLRAALLEVLQQFIDCGTELAQRAGLGTRCNPAGRAAYVDQVLNLAREIIDRALLPPFPHEKHGYAHCQNNRGD